MNDLRSRFKDVDRLDMPVRWAEVEERAGAPAVRRRGRPASWWSRMGTAAAALLLFALVGVFLWQAIDPGGTRSRPNASGPGGSTNTEPLAQEPAWTQLPEGPLSARHSATTFTIDGRVYVVGGRDTAACPPTADCAVPPEPALRDGAVFDPEQGHWELIAEAPVPLEALRGDVLGSTFYGVAGLGVDDEQSFLAYHADDDTWQLLPRPPLPHLFVGIEAAGTSIIAYQMTQENGVLPDFVYAPAQRTWRELPRDPLIPSFDRTIVWTPDGIVLIGIENVPQPGSEGPAVYRAAVLPSGSDRWRRLPDSDITGYDPSWFLVQGKLVNPTLGSSDGGPTNGWDRPYPHGGMLDPSTGAWFELPNPPEPRSSFPAAASAGQNLVTSFSGWALHVPTATWIPLDPPQQAATEGSATGWVGDQFFLWGGVRWDGDGVNAKGTLSNDGWMWAPGVP